MLKRSALPLCFLGVILAGCSEPQDDPTEPLFARVEVRMSRDVPKNYHTHATGAEEVPARETRAQGQLKLQLSKDGQSLSYRLNVANIENVTQAHLHLAPAGEIGGIVVWLYPSSPPMQLIPGRTQGTLASGEISAGDLTGALAGQPLSALIQAILAGNIYVNVHTTRFPPGEVRGQVEAGG